MLVLTKFPAGGFDLTAVHLPQRHRAYVESITAYLVISYLCRFLVPTTLEHIFLSRHYDCKLALVENTYYENR